MSQTRPFQPLHISATAEDFIGNNGNGKYLLLPGSDSRAKKISQLFDNIPIVRASSRGHNLYIGTITRNNITIDIGAISTGMGTPSVDIILNELIKLGASKFLRVGTCGLLQPDTMKTGDLAIATSAIRDEGTTTCYVPKEYPAIASYQMVTASISAAKKIMGKENFHVGIFHTKDSLYAREFKQGPLIAENTKYMQNIKKAGAIASEMEASMIFILANYAQHTTQNDTISGAICSVLGEDDDFSTPEQTENSIKLMLDTAIEAYFNLNKQLDS